MNSVHFQLTRIFNRQIMRTKALILVAFSCFSVNLIAQDSTILLEGKDARELLEKLGLPTEITIEKRALALIEWSSFEKKFQLLSADESCKLTRRLNNIMKNGTSKNLKRIQELRELQIGPILLIETCEDSYANLHTECIKLTQEFYIHHYIHETITQSTVIDTFAKFTALCPTMKMLGMGIDAFTMHENLTKAK